MQNQNEMPEWVAEFIRSQDGKMLAKDIVEHINAQGYPIELKQVYDFREANGLHSDLIVSRHCERCGKEFFSRIKTARYCSVGCQTKAYNTSGLEQKRKERENKPPKICVICGTEFRTSWKNQVCCSSECSYEYQIQRQKAKAEKQKAENYKQFGDGITKVCPICGGTFAITNIRSKNKVYCSKECHRVAARKANRESARRRRSYHIDMMKPPKRSRNFDNASQLTQTAIIAREHGMTYGKYQAQKYAAEHVKVRRAPAGYRKAGERE